MKLIFITLGIASALPIIFRRPRYRRTAKMIAVTTWGFFIALPFLLVGTVTAVSIVSNSATVRVLQEGLAAVAHPTQSQLIQRYARIDGVDYCHYFAGELRTSTLPRQEIRSFYAEKTIPPSDTSKPTWMWNGSIPQATRVHASFLDDPWIAGDPWWTELLREDSGKVSQRIGTAYIVYASVDGGFSFGDLRCGEIW